MKALVIEDQMMFRDVVVSLLRERLGCKEVTTGASCAAAREVFVPDRFDLAVLDLDLPDGDGLELARDFTLRDPHLRVLAISAQTDAYTLSRVLDSGAVGFVDKTQEDLVHLEKALREVLEWRMYFSRSVHDSLVQRRRDPKGFDKLLTEKETELMKYFGLGLRNEEIAPRAGIEASTVHGHRRAVMRKLGLSSSLQLMRYALLTGFTRVSDIHQLHDAD